MYCVANYTAKKLLRGLHIIPYREYLIHVQFILHYAILLSQITTHAGVELNSFLLVKFPDI